MRKCAFDGGNCCTALVEKMCIGCSFKKTKNELIEGRRKALLRVNGLPNPKRTYIIRTYHKQWRCEE